MSEENDKPDPELTETESALVNKLKIEDIEEIDKALLENSTNNWRKVAMVVGITMMKLPERVSGIPDVYYAQRVKELVNKGSLESQGNLSYMRYSEVRLPEGNKIET